MSSPENHVVIASIARTPVGAFSGGLASLPASDLGAVAIAAALERAGVEAGAVSEVILGQILGAGQDAPLPEDLSKVARLASSGLDALPELLRAMEHTDAAVRYWGATGVGNIGERSAGARLRMINALKDSSPSVRIAAARALAKLGDVKLALPVLEAELQSEHQWGRLAAAIVLDEMDEQAKPAIPALKKALVNQPNKYIVRVANRALNELLGTDNAVR